MTLTEIKESLGSNWAAYYDGLTKEEAFNVPCNSACGQAAGVWYTGTAEVVPELADRRIDVA